jgi:hypothetical protein
MVLLAIVTALVVPIGLFIGMAAAIADKVSEHRVMKRAGFK